MGEVYLVQHPRLPRHDALKVLRPDVSSDTSFRERFSVKPTWPQVYGTPTRAPRLAISLSCSLHRGTSPPPERPVRLVERLQLSDAAALVSARPLYEVAPTTALI